MVAQQPLKTVTLIGQTIRLVPMELAHVADLAIAGDHGKIWQWMLYGDVRGEEKMREWVEELLRLQTLGGDLPFTVIYLENDRAIGATRYLNINLAHRQLEIGGTWYDPAYWRTGVNTEAKYLLLRYAFETLGCLRVQFKTDLRNVRSQTAIERLGAVKEGVLRKHMITPDGHVRDSVIYSMLDSEWEMVKARLTTAMAKHSASRC